jgi:hypothetical protein
MKVVVNLHAYQNEMRAWRDKKVKGKIIEVGDLMLLRSPHTEASDKLEPKWVRPFPNNRENEARFSAHAEGKVLQHSWNTDKLHCFYIYRRSVKCEAL